MKVLFKQYLDGLLSGRLELLCQIECRVTILTDSKSNAKLLARTENTTKVFFRIAILSTQVCTNLSSNEKSNCPKESYIAAHVKRCSARFTC